MLSHHLRRTYRRQYLMSHQYLSMQACVRIVLQHTCWLGSCLMLSVWPHVVQQGFPPCRRGARSFHAGSACSRIAPDLMLWFER